MIKNIVVIALLFTAILTSGYIKPDVYKIDAQHNAINHNNLGLKAISEGNYSLAIQEFNLAIALNPGTQATAVYYNNLGEAYLKLGYYKDAQKCFETAITQYSLNFSYYQNLVLSFKCQKIVSQKIKEYDAKCSKSSLNMIMLGLLYISNGDTRRGIIKLDEFCMQEPALIITPAVRNYIQSIVPKY